MSMPGLTLDQIRPNPDWRSLPLFDRKDWKRLPFGLFSDSVNDRVDPSDAPEEIYVGLEHMEPGSLHIRTWGRVSNGTTFTRRCRPGQVLFGKRRAYQRKVAVAEFDAVVSGDIYVFAPKNDQLLPELLPFLCLSEQFYKYAVGTSAGSLSPRTNWSSLANFEFDLPPIDQQMRIAEVLWAVDEADTEYRWTEQANENLATATRNEVYSSSYPKIRLDEIATLITKGESPRWQGFDYQDDGPLFVTSENVLFGRYAPEPLKHIPALFHQKLRRSALKTGDVLFNLVGASIGRGCVLPDIRTEANVNQAVAVVRLDQSIANPAFILGHLLSQAGLKDILGTAVNTARANVSLSNLRMTQIPLPPISVQEDICDRLTELEQSQKLIQLNKLALGATRDTLLNLLFI